MPASSDFIVAAPAFIVAAPAFQSQNSPKVGDDGRAEERLGDTVGSAEAVGAPVVDADAKANSARGDVCRMGACSTVMQYALRSGPASTESVQGVSSSVYIGNVYGGNDGAEALRHSIDAYLGDRVEGAAAVTYACCVFKDPRLRAGIIRPHPRRAPAANGEPTTRSGTEGRLGDEPGRPRSCKRKRPSAREVAAAESGSGSDAGRNDGEDSVKLAGSAETGMTADVQQQQHMKRARQSAGLAVADGTDTASPQGGRSALVKGSQKRVSETAVQPYRVREPQSEQFEEESDDVEAREDEAVRWLSSLGIPLTNHTAQARPSPVALDAPIHAQSDSVRCGRASTAASEAARELQDLKSQLLGDGTEGSTGDVLGPKAGWEVDKPVARPEEAGQGSRAGGCNHSAGHVGYLLVQTSSTRAALQALRAVRSFLASGQAKKEGAGALNCSLGLDPGKVLAMAIRSCTSRPQLVELLLPFLSTTSELVGASSSATSHRSILIGPSKRGSKAETAVAESLKGARLDGETCAMALRRLSALPVHPRVKPGESWHAKLRRASKKGPQMPNIVDPEWRPRDRQHFRQQVVVAALLQRIFVVSKITRTYALATVMFFLTRVRERYLDLPGGFDWRYPRTRDPRKPHTGYREYGWPGLTYQVFCGFVLCDITRARGCGSVALVRGARS